MIKDGAFLVRKRNTGDLSQQPYTISLYDSMYDSKIVHIPINRHENGQFSPATKDKRAHRFNSIEELIAHLDRNNEVILKLTTKYK
jgi:hypothetical protein